MNCPFLTNRTASSKSLSGVDVGSGDGSGVGLLTDVSGVARLQPENNNARTTITKHFNLMVHQGSRAFHPPARREYTLSCNPYLRKQCRTSRSTAPSRKSRDESCLKKRNAPRNDRGSAVLDPPAVPVLCDRIAATGSRSFQRDN